VIVFESPEANQLRDIARDCLTELHAFDADSREAPTDSVIRRTVRTAAELGWGDIASTLPESAEHLAALFNGIGAHPTAAPLVDTLAAVPALVGLGDLEEAGVSILSPALTGDVLAVLALYGEDHSGKVDENPWHSVEFDDAGATGLKTLVRCGDLADVYVVTGYRNGTPVIAVAPSSASTNSDPLACPDRLSRLSIVHFNAAQYRVLAEGDTATGALGVVLNVARLAALAELTGLASSAIEQSVRYSLVREQFQRPVGSFQAVKHLLAEGRAAVHGLESVLSHVVDRFAAAQAIDALSAELDQAMLYAAHASQDVMDVALQVHGGIGYTLECPLSWYYLRTATLRTEWGEPIELAERIGMTVVAAR
jgi:alkylation response protein AidB-like acyl-CoA dehydrogenase